MDLINSRYEATEGKPGQNIVTIIMTDEEMASIRFNQHEKKSVSEGLASDKISANLKALLIIAYKLEGEARRVASENLIAARLNKTKINLN